MNGRIPGFLVLCLVLGLMRCAFANSAADENETRALAMRQVDAWNRHDAKAYADLFSEDADVVNVVGWWWKGRAEIERKLTAAYASMFKDSALTISDVQVRFLTPLIAIAHVHWSMIGAKAPPGIPEPRQGLQTLVMQKREGKWLIDVFQNTNALPEMGSSSNAPGGQGGDK